MEFKPLGNRILAKVELIEESPGGIAIPVIAQKGSKVATIVAMGGKTSNNLKVGDKIMFSRSSPLMLNEKPYIIVVEDDVIGTLK